MAARIGTVFDTTTRHGSHDGNGMESMLVARRSDSHWEFRGSRAFKWTLAYAIVAAIGAVSGVLPSIAAGMAVVSFLFALAFLRLPIIVTGVVLSTFASRFSVSVYGAEVRPEHLATIVLLLAILIRGRGADFLKHGLRPPAVYFLLYVVYSSVISILSPGTFLHGASILAWLFLDWVLLTSLLVANPPRQTIYDAIAWGSGLAAILALALWLLAETTGLSFGVQRGLSDLVPAAYGLSFEANILAGALLLSALALFSAPPQYVRRWHTLAGTIALAVLPFTQTRAAVLGMAAGLIVLLLRSRERFARRRAWRILAAATGMVVGVLIIGWQRLPLLEKFVGILDVSAGNGAYRLNIQGLALNDMQGAQSWVFGLGTNSFSQRHLDPSRAGLEIGAYIGSLPLQIIYDAGIIGCCLVLFLILDLLHSSRFSASSVTVLAAFIIVASATSPFWFATTWIFAALAALPREPDPVAHTRDRAKESALQGSAAGVICD